MQEDIADVRGVVSHLQLVDQAKSICILVLWLAERDGGGLGIFFLLLQLVVWGWLFMFGCFDEGQGDCCRGRGKDVDSSHF